MRSLRYLPADAQALRAVLSPAEMQATDRRAIEQIGVPGVALMESAGRLTAERVMAHGWSGDRVAILMGGGNNGGDGAVIGRYLAGWGCAVTLYLCAERDRIAGDAAVNLAACEVMGLPVTAVEGAGGLPPHHEVDLVVDALLGTGLKGDPRGAAAEAIRWANAWRQAGGQRGARPRVIVAVDIPSGVCGETGRAGAPSVTADETVTFAASKHGHWLYPGAGQVGALTVVDIGIPHAAMPPRLDRILGWADLAPAFAPRARDSHKGTFGHVAILGGGPGRTGAARMSTDAALRAGAGRVTLLTDPRVADGLAAQAYEGMVCPGWGEAGAHPLLDEADAVVVGPGLADDHGLALPSLLAGLSAPAVVDATGLMAFVDDPGALRAGGPRIITPHPGEAARLLGCRTDEIQGDRRGALVALMERTGAVVVLKGAFTLIGHWAEGAPHTAVCPAGNPGLATGGSGDVLAGVIGALLARGLDGPTAAAAGVLWHGRAGDAAAEERTEGSMLPRDVIQSLFTVERQEASCSHD